MVKITTDSLQPQRKHAPNTPSKKRCLERFFFGIFQNIPYTVSHMYLNCKLSRGASKKGALHSTLMTCWTWAPFSIVESIGFAWMLRQSSSEPERVTFEEKFFRLVEDLLP